MLKDEAGAINPAAGRKLMWTFCGIAVFAICAIGFPFLVTALGKPDLITLATRMAIYAIAAASLNLILGYGGLVSFGHAAYFGVGGYAVGILNQHFVSGEPFLGLVPGTNQFIVSMIVAMAVSGLFALVLGALSLRTSGLQFIMITLAFAQMVFFIFVSLRTYGGDDGLIVRRRNVLFGLNMADDAAFYFICIVIASIYFLIFARLVRSGFGLVLGGVRQNERRLAAIGIPTYRYKLTAFVIAGIGAGLAGAMMANFSKFISPDTLHWSQSGELMIMVIVGGAGTLLGPAVGAVLFLGLQTMLTGWTEHWQVILGPILVIIALFTNAGLLSWFQRRTSAGG